MSVFSCWPPASGDLMPMEKLYEDILKQLQGIHVNTEQALYEEIEKAFHSLTNQGDYVKSLIAQIPFKLPNIVLNKGELV
jgi:hypothetical protein